MSQKRAEMSHLWDTNVLGRDKSVHHHGDDESGAPVPFDLYQAGFLQIA
jgi:hypothetical protein